MINLNFQQAILSLDRLGLTDVILPFILIFTIMYAISVSVMHLGGTANEGKKLRLVISLVVALLVVIPHVTHSYPRGMDVVQIMNNSIPQIAMLIVGSMFALMLLGTLGIKSVGRESFKHSGKLVVGAFVVVGLIFWDNINTGSIGRLPLLGWFSNGDVQAILIIFIVFGLIVKLIVGDDDTKSKERKLAYNNAFNNHIKGNPGDNEGADAAGRVARDSIQ